MVYNFVRWFQKFGPVIFQAIDFFGPVTFFSGQWLQKLILEVCSIQHYIRARTSKVVHEGENLILPTDVEC